MPVAALVLPGQTCENLEALVRRAGLGDILKISALLSMGDLHRHSLAPYQESPGLFQRRALATAVLMEFMAHDNGENPSQAFLIGLFHNLGQIPIARFLKKLKPNVKAPSTDSFPELAKWERSELGVDHAKVAGKMLEDWEFPEAIYHPIGWHLHPMLTGRYKRLSCMLHISRLLSKCLVNPNGDCFRGLELPVGLLSLCDVRKADIAAYLPSALAWYRSTCEPKRTAPTNAKAHATA